MFEVSISHSCFFFFFFFLGMTNGNDNEEKSVLSSQMLSLIKIRVQSITVQNMFQQEPLVN